MSSASSYITIYGRSTISGLTSVNGSLSEKALSYLRPLIENGPSYYIDNLTSEMGLIVVNDKMIPFTINSKLASCYLVSVSAIVNSYVKLELGLEGKSGWRSMLCSAIDLANPLLRLTQVDRVVFINDWLLSTNPTIRLTDDEMYGVIESMAREYPSYSLIFKSLKILDDGTPDKVRPSNGYGMFEYKSNFCIYPKAKKTRNNASDLALLRKTKYQLQELKVAREEDLACFVSLYTALYFGRYSKASPRLNQEWFRHTINSGLFRCMVLRDGINIIGFSFQLICQDQLISSYIGYDVSLPTKDGVYRLLMLSGLLKAKEEGLVYNMSGSGRWPGVSTFKRQRGAVLKQQYGAHYSAHLPWPRNLIHTFIFRNLYRS